MEIITIESQAFSRLMQKLEHISAYVEEARRREEEERQSREQEKQDGRKRDAKWMTNKEVCEALEISPRTLQRYRTKGILPYSMIEKQIRYPRKAIENIREQWMVETPSMRLDRMIQAHPLHELKNKIHAEKRRNTGKNK